MVVLGCVLQQRAEPVGLALSLHLLRGSLAELDAGLARQFLQGAAEIHPLVFHHEVEDIAASVASEAVPALVVREDVERRRLLGVEGTEALEVSAGLLELNIAPDEVGDVERFFDLVDDSHRRFPTAGAVLTQFGFPVDDLYLEGVVLDPVHGLLQHSIDVARFVGRR